MITIPDEFLTEIDRVAAAEHRSRSELFREAIRRYLKGPAPRQTMPSAQRAAGVIEELRKQAASRAGAASDSTQMLRAIRGYSDDELVSHGDDPAR